MFFWSLPFLLRRLFFGIELACAYSVTDVKKVGSQRMLKQILSMSDPL